MSYSYFLHVLLHLSCSLADRWGITANFTTYFLYSSPFSAFRGVMFHSRPVHSFMLSPYHFLCLPLRLLPCTVPCRIVLANPDDCVILWRARTTSACVLSRFHVVIQYPHPQTWQTGFGRRAGWKGRGLSCGHTAQKSRKRMNHAQNSSLTRYMRDLRISSVCLTSNLRSCPPMFAGSELYAIPGFEQLKTRLRVRVYAILRCFT